MTEAEFRDTMKGLHTEFSELNKEALALQAEIDKNMKELTANDPVSQNKQIIEMHKAGKSNGHITYFFAAS